MRYIGIDYGDARVGLATGDDSLCIATAAGTLKVTGMRDAVRQIGERVGALGGGAFVVGLPKNMNGSESFRAEKSRAFAEMLTAETGLPVFFTDERLTTCEAYTYLNITGFNGKKRRNIIDTLSAEIILQSFLDTKKASAAQ